MRCSPWHGLVRPQAPVRCAILLICQAELDQREQVDEEYEGVLHDEDERLQ